MKWLQNKWMCVLLLISITCIIANGIVLYQYRSVFNGSISHELNDWNLFIEIFNGIITTILAIVNICAIFSINATLDSNSEKRHINNLLFEAQTILAKMRLDDYNLIKELINEIKVSIYEKRLSSEKIELLKKKLMGMDNSFLYKSQTLQESPFLRPITEKLVVQIGNFIHKVREREVEAKDEKELLHCLTLFQNIMEFYVISQLVRGNNVQQYISDNQNEMDCTISCIYDFARELNEMVEEDNKNNRES
jgi:hypothetical protein